MVLSACWLQTSEHKELKSIGDKIENIADFVQGNTIFKLNDRKI